MKKMFRIGLFSLLVTLLMCSCTTMKNNRASVQPLVKFEKGDFILSDQVTATATVTKVLFVEWSNLFNDEEGAIGSSALPLVGGLVSNSAEAKAIYELLKANPDYDVVLYPQFETKISKPVLGIGALTQITTVKVTARMGKLKK